MDAPGRLSLFLAIAFAEVLLLQQPAGAATKTWSGLGAGNKGDSTDNSSPSRTPVAGSKRGWKMNLERALQSYHQAVDEFSRGDPEPAKKLFTRRDDVTLANPWGPAVRGWKQVSEALDFASSRFRDGKVTSFETLAEYETADLATILEVEKWNAKVGGKEEVASFELRVTSTFRLEDGVWKLVHRHADPISKPNPEGPLRSPGG